MFEIEYYNNSNNKSVFEEWFNNLRDKQAKTRIINRINFLERGGLGDCKPVRDGVWELRIDYGTGYRIYYSMIGKKLILLLCGGDKRTQNRDIEQAIKYLEDYKKRKL